ncbi:hypothetical protein GOP47_0022963 [Adiantum capillus-veneris]|uniref:Uncharacterized protein n=1 Tax=Adiantum capillus-veneris TaxID=13818 RepID=A0A9D4Z5U3_ADICA|nr:hypothetical protein GOP47_0022963 [Adiantum capillus-veneris]
MLKVNKLHGMQKFMMVLSTSRFHMVLIPEGRDANIHLGKLPLHLMRCLSVNVGLGGHRRDYIQNTH